MMRVPMMLLCVAALLLSVPAFGWDPNTHWFPAGGVSPSAQPTPSFWVHPLPGSHVGTVAAIVGKLTHKKIVVDPSVAGMVMDFDTRDGPALDRESLLARFQSDLASQGLMMVEDPPGTFTISKD